MNILLWSVLVSIIIAWIGLFLFRKLWILDSPWKYKDLKRKTPVPRLMWIFLIISTLVSIIIFLPWYWNQKEIQFLFIWAVILWIIAVWDDIKWIWAKERFAIQIILSLITIIWWWAIISNISFFWELIQIPYFLWVILALVWFILIINALNRFDWINWMWAWLASIWFFTIACLIRFVIFPNYEIWTDMSAKEHIHLVFLLNLSLIMTWVSSVFTLIEYKPCGLIRDVWIMFLWFVLAYLSLFAGWKIGLLTVVLSLVIFDAFWVILNRLKNRKNPMKWDYTHFHHRLMRHWWSRAEIRFFVRSWSISLMILMILQWTQSINKYIIFAMIFLGFFTSHIYVYRIKKLPHGMWDRDEN